MGLLLDTHALLWWLADHPRLTTSARARIEHDEVFVSTVSIWEIAIKRKLGKLVVGEDFLRQVTDQGFADLPFGRREAWLAGHLERHHGDPFDRALIAQALIGELPVLTHDPRFADYGVEVIAT